MKKKVFKVGHVVEHEGKVGVITTNEINGIMSFKTLDGDSYEIASDRVYGIPLSDKLFVSMGFDFRPIARTKMQNPNLEMFDIVKLDNDIEHMGLFEHPFLWVHKGTISYSKDEKVEIYTVFYRRKELKACCSTRINTLDELQDFFEYKKLKLEFDDKILRNIEQTLIQERNIE